jgi:ribonuclease HII
MLKRSFSEGLLEAGCDESGRGCLAGPVFAAAVIFPPGYENEQINDSKKLNKKQRAELREIIQVDALAWAVASVSNGEIDTLNILNASIRAMHNAILQLKVQPQLLLVDGNRFHPFETIPHQCIIKGDGIYLSIAAASILAKTYRDDAMLELHREFPQYGWNLNKGYASKQHCEQIYASGLSIYHRKSFHLKGQLKLDFGEF